MINLKIYEENNNLSFKENYAPIVCGNSNYEITFEFDSDWQTVSDKTAIIVANSQKTAIDFSGNTLTLPAMPNCNSFLLIVLSSEGETIRLVTSPIEIKAVPTTYAESLPEFAPLTTYVSELLTKIKNLIDGTTKAKTSEKADTATIAENVSNPNLLINGDFKINQREQNTYTCTKNEYTVDRWLGASGLTVTKNTSSVTISNTNASGSVLFQQKLEESFSSFAGKTLCLSAKANDSLFYVSAVIPETQPSSATVLASKQIAEGVSIQFAYQSTNVLSVGVSVSAGKTITLEHFKLEFGSLPTLFSARGYSEELALCQRFYQRITPSKSYGTFGSGLVISVGDNNVATSNVLLYTLTKMRIEGTITFNGTFQLLASNFSSVTSLTKDGICGNAIILCCVGGVFTKGSAIVLRANGANTYIEINAEIY